MPTSIVNTSEFTKTVISVPNSEKVLSVDVAPGGFRLFYPQSSNFDKIDEDNIAHFYFGWAPVNGGWLVRRQNRSNSSAQDASIDNNSSYSDLNAAWAARSNLNYL